MELWKMWWTAAVVVTVLWYLGVIGWLHFTLLILGLVAVVVLEMWGHGRRVEQYFKNAVQVYSFTGNEDTRVAALAAAKVIDRVRRESLLNEFKILIFSGQALAKESSSDLQNMYGAVNERLEVLCSEIASRDWSVQDARLEKERLGRLNPGYLKALDKADPNMFVRNFPMLFEKK